MLYIPIAFVEGIIENKIADELTKNDTKVKEHLEDIKSKIYRHKPKVKQLNLLYENGWVEITDVMSVTMVGNFVEVLTKDKHILYNSNEIKKMEIKDDDIQQTEQKGN